MNEKPLATPIRVALRADRVLSPVVRYATGNSPDEPDFSSISFLTEDDRPGRVVFEGFDALRVSRGELAPFEIASRSADDWVFVVRPSAWLAERHEYELKHYDTPLLDEYDHYLFEFHDEFAEAIAKGIWIDAFDPKHPEDLPSDHPLTDMPAEWTSVRDPSYGIEWEMRRNPAPSEQLLEASHLCSQKLFQFNLILDGSNRRGRSVRLRTRDGATRTVMGGDWGRDVSAWPGVADFKAIREPWLAYVAEVAERRRKMGKR